MLRINKLCYSPPANDRHSSTQVLTDVNFSVSEGEFLAIVGPNGCGKTTLLRLISGLIRPTDGYILLRGQEIDGPGQGIGMIFQEIALLPWKTVKGNIGLGLASNKELTRKEKGRLVKQYIHQVGLKDFEHHYPHQLSGGMRQKVAIARTLINDPDVLLMDEPFAALDCLTRNVLQEFLVPLWQQSNKTIIFVTHNVDEAVFLSERVIILSCRPGRIMHEIRIDLPRPRDRADEQSQKIRGEILSLLGEETPCFNNSLEFKASGFPAD